jgi:hypothetical protein
MQPRLNFMISLAQAPDITLARSGASQKLIEITGLKNHLLA